MNKKGQGISINVIIIAAIGLAVLVVLFAIFTGRLGIFTKTLKDTDTCAQKCSSINMKLGNLLTQDTKSCPGDNQYIAGEFSDGKYGCCCAPKT